MALSFALAIRALQLLAGLLLLFGIEGMITSSGFVGPNLIVWLGILGIGLCTAVAWRTEKRPFAGLWVSALAVALPLLSQAASHLNAPACPADHPPLTESYFCVAPGYPAVLVISAIVVLLSIVAGFIELRAVRARLVEHRPQRRSLGTS